MNGKIICIGIVSLFLLTGFASLSTVGMKATIKSTRISENNLEREVYNINQDVCVTTELSKLYELQDRIDNDYMDSLFEEMIRVVKEKGFITYDDIEAIQNSQIKPSSPIEKFFFAEVESEGYSNWALLSVVFGITILFSEYGWGTTTVKGLLRQETFNCQHDVLLFGFKGEASWKDFDVWFEDISFSGNTLSCTIVIT